ncbi:zinc-ribbon domain-containing protein [Enterococcus sp. DIV0187]|uniref:zinc ribbon domain-containing protein n=1 Tax=Enterococcus sp. DIV0187 TaxID=2774644 RepID=UPI003F1EC367
MKYCPNCGTENQESALFCEQCGHHFISDDDYSDASDQKVEHNDENVVRSSQKKHFSNKVLLVLGAVIILGVIVGTRVYSTMARNQEPDSPARTSLVSSQTSESSVEDISKYDDIIQEAKKLTINGEYKESSLKLASIPASKLAKENFNSIREEVEELEKENNQGIQEEKNKNNSNDQTSQNASNSGFNGDFAKWANTYTFYYSQGGQKQSSLTISANGGVTQNNYGGKQYFGKATITGAAGNILSYETTTMYPRSMPDTKTIRPDAKITVQWDSGSSQTFYGYLSYSSRLALTDGVTKNDGVNEVWISY